MDKSLKNNKSFKNPFKKFIQSIIMFFVDANTKDVRDKLIKQTLIGPIFIFCFLAFLIIVYMFLDSDLGEESESRETAANAMIYVSFVIVVISIVVLSIAFKMGKDTPLIKFVNVK